jgi:hypothetical protein
MSDLDAKVVDESRPGDARWSIRCPQCDAPLGIHMYAGGTYITTRLSRYLVKLADGTYGRSRRGRRDPHNSTRSVYDDPEVSVPMATELEVDVPALLEARNAFLRVASIVVHCPTRSCGSRRIRIAAPRTRV